MMMGTLMEWKKVGSRGGGERPICMASRGGAIPGFGRSTFDGADIEEDGKLGAGRRRRGEGGSRIGMSHANVRGKICRKILMRPIRDSTPWPDCKDKDNGKDGTHGNDFTRHPTRNTFRLRDDD